MSQEPHPTLRLDDPRGWGPGGITAALHPPSGSLNPGEDRSKEQQVVHLRKAALVAALLMAVSCGSNGAAPEDPGGPPTTKATTGEAVFPVTLDTSSGTVVIDARPERIVSLSPTATEMLFAVGAGDQVIAVDDQSNYPPEAPTTKLSGFETNVEAVLEYEPDLVVASAASGGLGKSMKAVKVPLLVQPAATIIDDTYSQMEELGAATGNIESAHQAAAAIKTKLDELVASIPEFEQSPTYYHELDDTYFSATSDTFIGNVYTLFGLENIADKADGAGTGYPQLSAEYIVSADPDLIFLADTKCCGQSASTVARRPGWDHITAVQNGGVVELDDDIASRWGPRIVEYARIVADSLTRMEQAG
jgi:iron complex transport system substrate-binding protein